VVLYWQDVAPAADAASVISFDETDPAEYPAAGWAIYDGWSPTRGPAGCGCS